MKYIYLPYKAYVATWVDGGNIPLKSARNYLSREREGTRTPDECNTQAGVGLSGQDADFMRSVIIGDTGGVHGRFVKMPGGVLLENVHLEFTKWDGLILCLSNVESRDICRKLGFIACIAVENVDGLYQQLTRQLNVEGQSGDCCYTEGPYRDVFTKAAADAWQQEYRMFWPIEDDHRIVSIMPGTGVCLWILKD